MTTEIAIMNKNAVALAADSAVSTNNKIFQSANKIFSLSKHSPVAIMVYSNADFCGIPWESIIKKYRNNLGKKKFIYLNEYANDFINYIKTDSIIEESIIDDTHYVTRCANFFSQKILKDIEERVEKIIKEQGRVENDIAIKVINSVFESDFDLINNARALDIRNVISESDFFTKYELSIESVFKKQLVQFEDIVDDFYIRFKKSIYNLSTSNLFPLGYSGLVFAGFGENEFFPSVINFLVGNFILNELQIIENKEKSQSITHHNDATIIPYAQEDIINMFVEGVHPKIKNNTFDLFYAALQEQTSSILTLMNVSNKKIIDHQDSIRKLNSDIIEKIISIYPSLTNEFIYPTLNTVAILPPKELANLAESLVNLTSIKRQVSQDRETVGGPTDVALISKGDGLIWVKRKHYFDPNLNHHFFNNYFDCGETTYEKNQCEKNEDDLQSI